MPNGALGPDSRLTGRALRPDWRTPSGSLRGDWRISNGALKPDEKLSDGARKPDKGISAGPLKPDREISDCARKLETRKCVVCAHYDDQSPTPTYFVPLSKITKQPLTTLQQIDKITKGEVKGYVRTEDNDKYLAWKGVEDYTKYNENTKQIWLCRFHREKMERKKKDLYPVLGVVKVSVIEGNQRDTPYKTKTDTDTTKRSPDSQDENDETLQGSEDKEMLPEPEDQKTLPQSEKQTDTPDKTKIDTDATKAGRITSHGNISSALITQRVKTKVASGKILRSRRSKAAFCILTAMAFNRCCVIL